MHFGQPRFIIWKYVFIKNGELDGSNNGPTFGPAGLAFLIAVFSYPLKTVWKRVNAGKPSVVLLLPIPTTLFLIKIYHCMNFYVL